MLYVVATPIGNLGDMSPRAVEILRSVDLIAAEDTRHSLRLLNHFDIRTPMTSYHEHNERSKAQALVTRMRDEGISVALISDAGTPAISDPGAILVREAAQAGIEVVAVPGPHAAAAALSLSGFVNPEYSFFGFPPREKRALAEKLSSLKGRAMTAVFHESPHRVDRLMQAALDVFGDVPAVLCCDLSKLYEKTTRGPLSQVLAAFLNNEKARKGEYVLLLDLSGTQADQPEPRADMTLEARLVERMLAGESLREAQEVIVAAGEKKNALYAAALRLKALFKAQVDSPIISKNRAGAKGMGGET